MLTFRSCELTFGFHEITSLLQQVLEKIPFAVLLCSYSLQSDMKIDAAYMYVAHQVPAMDSNLNTSWALPSRMTEFKADLQLSLPASLQAGIGLMLTQSLS